MASLPPADTRRWVVRRKAAVVAAVQGGKITLEEACRRYNLSEEEFRAWQRAFEAHGLPGLRATRLQQYRTPPARGRGAADFPASAAKFRCSAEKIPLFGGVGNFPRCRKSIACASSTHSEGAKSALSRHFPVEQGIWWVRARARDWLSQGFPHSFVV